MTASGTQRRLSYIDGLRLKKAILAAARCVAGNEEQLNRINVFPVADRDTGTNMARTLRGAVDGLRNAGDPDLSRMSALLAESALLNARGNSGVILAQFFQGMAGGFRGRRRVGLDDFAIVMIESARSAKTAVAAPAEGTILTVMHDWAEGVHNRRHSSQCFRQLMNDSLEDARESLQRTPGQLKVLSRANVVDAGAQGFVQMIEGIVRLIESGDVDFDEAEAADAIAPALATIDDDTEFRYCTECMVSGVDLDLKSLRSMAQSLGNSLVVAGGGTRVRIHVHTNDPESLFLAATTFGVVSGRKHEDMWAQRWEGAGRVASVAVITDSSCDLPASYLLHRNIHVVPVRISFGKKEYLDRVTITSEEVYDLLDQSPEPPKTSQPTPDSFMQAYDRAAERHKEAIAVLVSGAASGTFQSGVVAAQLHQMKIEVVDSRTSSAALGFLVETAAEAAREGCSLEEIRRRVEDARDRVKVFFTVSSPEHLIRTGRIGGAAGTIAKWLRLVPILSFSPRGVITPVAKSRRGSASLAKLLDIVVKESSRLSRPRFYVCHSKAEAEAEYAAGELVRRLGIEPPEILKVSPTMGAMVGPGACAIAIMGEKP